ncbi:Heat stress transcription factor A-3, partial [Mucuna pruriens]
MEPPLHLASYFPSLNTKAHARQGMGSGCFPASHYTMSGIFDGKQPVVAVSSQSTLITLAVCAVYARGTPPAHSCHLKGLGVSKPNLAQDRYPTHFPRHVSPRNFKHNIFSSFIGRLNAHVELYIANSNTASLAPNNLNPGVPKPKFVFLHLLHFSSHLTFISRDSARMTAATSVPASKAGLEFEIERLRKERSVLMQEGFQSAELIQKQIVSFLAKLFENPAFLTCLCMRRRFVKQHKGQIGAQTQYPNRVSDFSKEGQIVRNQFDWRNVTISSEIPEMYPVSLEESLNYLSQALAKELSEGESDNR